MKPTTSKSVNWHKKEEKPERMKIYHIITDTFHFTENLIKQLRYISIIILLLFTLCFKLY